MDTDPTICCTNASSLQQSLLSAGTGPASAGAQRVPEVPRLPFDERNIRIACMLSASLATLDEEAALLDRLIGPELQRLFGR